jgi:hypothetical protein
MATKVYVTAFCIINRRELLNPEAPGRSGTQFGTKQMAMNQAVLIT